MLYQNLTQKQQLKIHPQQLQMLHLFHLNSIELEQRIQNELEDNPLIETVDDVETGSELEGKEASQDYQDWDEMGYDDTADYNFNVPAQNNVLPERPIVEYIDFRAEALNQLQLLSLDESTLQLAVFILYSLDEEGFLVHTAEEIADDYSMKQLQLISTQDVERAIEVIQSLEPVGLGTRNIRECMLMQLKRLNVKAPDVKLAIRLMQDHYEDLKSRDFNRLMNTLNIDEDELQIALDMLATLRLKPVPKADDVPVQYDTIVPDFIIEIEDNCIEVSLFREKASSLKINSSWKQKVKDFDGDHPDKATSKYLSNKLQAAEWFVSAIKQRESTMLRVMKAIAHIQSDYFLTGDEMQIKPMILKNVSDMVGADISTVSRITCNKYVQTPSGNLLIKDLFNEGIANQEGVIVSVRKVQEAIQHVVHKEDKTAPLSDQQIADILTMQGFQIARRTVAKYRDELNIPVAQMRWNGSNVRNTTA
jgi:RNA polymerase sigma-54 factor